MIHEKLFPSTNQDCTTSFTWKNSKIFNIASKYFSIFNNKSPVTCRLSHFWSKIFSYMLFLFSCILTYISCYSGIIVPWLVTKQSKIRWETLHRIYDLFSQEREKYIVYLRKFVCSMTFLTNKSGTIFHLQWEVGL